MQLLDEALASRGLGAAEQLAGLFPGQLERHAFGVLTSGGSLRDGAGRRGASRGNNAPPTARAPTQPNVARSSVAWDRCRLRAVEPPVAEHRVWPRQGRSRTLGKRGAATAALIAQRRGAMRVVDVQPAHHGLRVTPGALGHSRRTGAWADLVQGQEALAGASLAGAERQLPQIGWRLLPALVVNT